MAPLIILILVLVVASIALALAVRKRQERRGGPVEQSEENPELLRRPLRSRYPR